MTMTYRVEDICYDEDASDILTRRAQRSHPAMGPSTATDMYNNPLIVASIDFRMYLFLAWRKSLTLRQGPVS